MYGYYTQRHKVFISFYHHDDQVYKNYIDRYLSSNIINKSVMEGEYCTDNSDEYIKRLIREDKISDSSVVVVLVGPNTKNRKHVDWEIYAGLRPSINGNSGLIGFSYRLYVRHQMVATIMRICQQDWLIILNLDMRIFMIGTMQFLILIHHRKSI